MKPPGIRMRLHSLLLCTALAISSAAHAELEKFVLPAGQGVSFHWWPKLQPVLGWHQDRDQSLAHGINALAPDGQDFKNADAVMYARALYKPLVPEIKSLDALIERDKKEFAASLPGAAINEVATILTADGKRLRSLTFFSKEKGLWERVSYGEEGDFYLTFTLSSTTLSGFISAADAYEKLVTSYRE